MPNLQAIADDLPASAWQPLQRPARYDGEDQPRQRPDNVKEAVVVAAAIREPASAVGGGRRIQLPAHRLPENVPHGRGQEEHFGGERREAAVRSGRVLLLHHQRSGSTKRTEIVFSANDRCDQENVLAQLAGGVRALRAPVDNLDSNWAYMVMTALAWNLKAWWALLLPEQPGRCQEKHRAEKRWVLRLEFKTFVNAFVHLPCQIVRGGRKLIYRLVGWNPHQPIFFRLVDVLRC